MCCYKNVESYEQKIHKITKQILLNTIQKETPLKNIWLKK